MPSKPKWTHDCAQCEYLGSVTLNGIGSLLSTHYDLYVCEHTARPGKSYLARYDSEPSAYASLPESAFTGFLGETTLGEASTHELALVLARIQDRDRNAPRGSDDACETGQQQSRNGADPSSRR